MLKPCFKCGATKPLSEFYRHPMMGDGHLGKCKDCAKADVRKNRADKSEFYRAYDRLRYYEHGYRRITPAPGATEAKQRWLERNKHKRAAHKAVQNAVRSGRMVKPAVCEDCGAGGRIHGHHDDYSKPLVVRWLCPKCHGAWHRKYDEAETRALVEQHRNSA
jgi:hypothetical protein